MAPAARPRVVVMKRLAGLRKSYEAGELDESQATSAPLQLFEKWFAAAEKADVDLKALFRP